MTVLRSRKTLSSSPKVPTMETPSEPSTPAKTLDPSSLASPSSITSTPAHLGVSVSAPPPRRSLRLAPFRSGDQVNPSVPNRKRMSVRVTHFRLNKVRVSDRVGMGNRVVTGELDFQTGEGRDGVASMVGEVALESFREGRGNGVSDENGEGERKLRNCVGGLRTLEVASEDLLDQGTLSLRSGKKVSKSIAGGSGGFEKVGIDENNRVFCIGGKNIRLSDSDGMGRVVVGELDMETGEGREEVVTNVDQVTMGVTGSTFGLKSFGEARGNGMSDEKRQGKRKFGNVGGLRTLESVSKDCLDKGILSLRSGKKVMKRMVGVGGVFENAGTDEKAIVSDIGGKKLRVSAHRTGMRSVGDGELDSETEEGREEVFAIVDEVTKGETGSTCLTRNGLSAEKGEGNLKWGNGVDLRTSELVSEGCLDKVILSLRSGKKVTKRIVEGSRGDVGNLVHDNNKEGGMTNKSKEYLGVVLDNVDLNCKVEIPVGVGLDKYQIDDDIDSGTRARRRLDEQEKGKGKMFDDILVGNIDEKEEKEPTEDGGKGIVVEDGGLSNGIPVVKLDLEPNIGESTKVAVLGGHSLADVSIKYEGQVAETSTKASVMQGRVSKARFRDIAKKNASRFAHFTSEEVEENGSTEEAGREMPEMVAEKEVEDWPGPFSTAMKIIKEREMNVNVLQQNSSSAKIKPASLVWVPKEDHNRDSPKILIPSLQDICLAILAKNADAITSLDSVPDMLRHKLTKMLCDSRKMNGHFLDLLVQGSPSEIRISECSSLTEEQLVNAFQGCDASKLMVLQLDLCGRCMPDYVLRSTLARSPNSLPALTTISLNGAYRLSDAGLSGLVVSAPALRSINLSQCSLLTSDGIKIIADSLGSVLRELSINNCENIDAVLTLPALLKLENLEVLSLAGVGTVCDDFLGEFIALHGRHIKELILTDCKKLTDASLKVIADNCKGLRTLNLGNLHGLTDSTMGYLANGCRAIQSLKLCRNSFSDEAVAAYLEASGEALEDLSLCHINKVSYNTAISLARCSQLLSLDLSWCRNLPDEALGLIVDSCLSLKELNLFGCTQVTDIFLDGHSNPYVQIIGLKTPILQNLKVPDPLEGPLHYSSVPS